MSNSEKTGNQKRHQNHLTYLVLILFLTALTIAYGYTKFIEKTSITAVLQHEVGLDNESGSIFAITTFDQTLSDGKNIPKGSVLIGMINKEQGGYSIDFNSVRSVKGTNEQINAKSTISYSQKNEDTGLSANIGKTLYRQTESSVLGAIFHNPQNNIKSTGNDILPRGTVLKIEIE